MGWRGLPAGGKHTQKEVVPKKNTSCVMEKYVEDAKQDEKDVPDLLEPIMKGSGLVNEELRPILFKSNQFRPKILKIKVSTFWIPEI